MAQASVEPEEVEGEEGEEEESEGCGIGDEGSCPAAGGSVAMDEEVVDSSGCGDGIPGNSRESDKDFVLIFFDS